MSESLNSRACSIRDYLGKLDLPRDPALIFKYSSIASRWEAVRLLIDRGNATPADDRRFLDLTRVLRALTEKIGLDACTEQSRGPDDIPGLTRYRGFLPCDPQRLLYGVDWQTAAEGW